VYPLKLIQCELCVIAEVKSCLSANQATVKEIFPTVNEYGVSIKGQITFQVLSISDISGCQLVQCQLAPSLLPRLWSHRPLSNVFQPRVGMSSPGLGWESLIEHSSPVTLSMVHVICSVVSGSLSTVIPKVLLKRNHLHVLLCFCFQLFLVSVSGIVTGDSIGPCSNLSVNFYFKLMMMTAGSARYI